MTVLGLADEDRWVAIACVDGGGVRQNEEFQAADGPARARMLGLDGNSLQKTHGRDASSLCSAARALGLPVALEDLHEFDFHRGRERVVVDAAATATHTHIRTHSHQPVYR